MNGEDDNYILRIQLHNFLSDIALGVTPWLNATSICNQIKEPKYTGIAKNLNSIRPIDEYLGLYSNPIYGNLAVEKNHNNEHLVLRYGDTTWNLWPRSEKDQFKAEGTGIIKYLKDMNNITFRTTNDEIDSVLAVSFCSTCRSSRPDFFIQRPISLSFYRIISGVFLIESIVVVVVLIFLCISMRLFKSSRRRELYLISK